MEKRPTDALNSKEQGAGQPMQLFANQDQDLPSSGSILVSW
jgi:hypothetical protein